MGKAQPLGTAWAWVVGDRWVYTRDRDEAPPDAIEVTGYGFEGKLVLHHTTGGAGRFIWDAIRFGDVPPACEGPAGAAYA